MRVKQDEPFEIQPRANAALGRVLSAGTVLALVASVLGVLVPGRAGTTISWVGVATVMALPLGRVALLGVRWIIRRDYLFSILAFGLLTVVLAGAVAALLLR